MTQSRSESLPVAVRARIDECIHLFAESVEEITADDVRGVLIAAKERNVVYLCAQCILVRHPGLEAAVYQTLREIAFAGRRK